MSTESILRSAAQIASATSAQLVATYNAMTGKAIKKFENRAIAERKVEMALLSATDAAGHTGVARNTVPVPMTVEELAAKAPAVAVAQALAHQDADDGEKPTNNEPEIDLDDPALVDPDVNPFKPGTMSHQLWVATKALQPITRREVAAKKTKAERAASPGKSKLVGVIATFAGTSKTQEGSTRAGVLKYINDAKDSKGNLRAVTIDELDAHISANSRGYVQKLIEKNHCTPVEDQQGAA